MISLQNGRLLSLPLKSFRYEITLQLLQLLFRHSSCSSGKLYVEVSVRDTVDKLLIQVLSSSYSVIFSYLF